MSGTRKPCSLQYDADGPRIIAGDHSRRKFAKDFTRVLGDLKTRKSTGTSCQIEIHFSSQTGKLLIKYDLPRLQFSDGGIIFFTEHYYKLSTSFIKEKNI